MATQEAVQPLFESIKATLPLEQKSLVSRSEWGKLNFISAKQDLDRIFGILKHLSVLPLEYLTDQAVGQITNQMTPVRTPLEQIDKFSVEQPNARQVRDNLIVQIHQSADQLYTLTASWIPFLAYQKGDVAQNIENLTRSVSEANSLVQTARNDIQSKAKEIDHIVEKAREASAAAGAAVFTKDFANEAGTLLTKAATWLKAAAALGIVTLIIAILAWFWTPAGLDSGQIWQKVASKLIALSILFTATLWCGRIYKAIMHQAALYKLRALSLQTFQAFSAAASDEQTKNAVLLETTRSIFAQGVTGYVNNAPTPEPEARVIEIMKSIVRKD